MSAQIADPCVQSLGLNLEMLDVSQMLDVGQVGLERCAYPTVMASFFKQVACRTSLKFGRLVDHSATAHLCVCVCVCVLKN